MSLAVRGAAGRIKDRVVLTLMMWEGKGADIPKTIMTPHTVVVEKDGRRASSSVTMDRRQELEIRL